jgi:hypothetical protein
MLRAPEVSLSELDVQPLVPTPLPAKSGERRRRRSEDPITALHYQLSHTRGEARLEAVVLVDDTGCLVAGAGAWPLCEELAAFAPLLADSRGRGGDGVRSHIAALGPEVFVRTISLDGCEALLCGRGGGQERASLIARAADGCQRILAG